MHVARLLLSLALLGASVFAVFAAPGAYRLGPEDTVTVTVIRHPEFSGDFLIPPDGGIDLPAAGQVQAAGKTLDELTSTVKERLKVRLLRPEVNVTLKNARVQRVYVLGAVNKPGVYDYKEGWHIAEAIAVAGGLSLDPADCRASLSRAGEETQRTVDLTAVMNAKTEADLPLAPGDVLKIEALTSETVTISGQVKTPGQYRFKPGETLVSVLTKAGGTLENAGLSRVAVTHATGVNETVNLIPALVEGRSEYDIVLTDGDMVLVPEATGRVAVLGFVNKPGYYSLRDGQRVTLSDALGLAGGTDNKRAGLSAIALLRTHPNGKQERYVMDITRFLKQGDLGQNPEVRAGDIVYVPETRKVDWDTVFRAISAFGAFLGPVL